MAKRKPYTINPSTGAKEFLPSTDTIDGKINVSGPNKILWRTDSGEGPHQEGTIGGLTAETTPAAGHLLLAEVAGVLKSIDVGDLPGGSGGSSLPYTAYVAKINQASGTTAPVATVLSNTLSGTPVWARVSAGLYSCTLTGEFTSPETIVTPDSFSGYYFASIPLSIFGYRANDNTVMLESSDGVDLFDNGFSDIFFMIQIFNGGGSGGGSGLTFNEVQTIAFLTC